MVKVYKVIVKHAEKAARRSIGRPSQHIQFQFPIQPSVKALKKKIRNPINMDVKNSIINNFVV